MATGRAESDFGLQGWIDTLGLKQIFSIFSVRAFHFVIVRKLFFTWHWRHLPNNGSNQRSGFYSQSGLNFFRLFFNCLGCSFNCEDHFHIHFKWMWKGSSQLNEQFKNMIVPIFFSARATPCDELQCLADEVDWFNFQRDTDFSVYYYPDAGTNKKVTCSRNFLLTWSSFSILKCR